MTHNPEDVPQSAVPSGWRFMHAHEVGKLPKGTPCKTWSEVRECFRRTRTGAVMAGWTYIVPAETVLPADELATLRDAVKAAHEALERSGQSHVSAAGNPMCPECSCMYCYDEEHKEDCYIGQALKLLQPHVTKP